MAQLAALYARISKTDANVPKVENQLADLEALAARRGYTVAERYIDDGLSAAKAENRPDFDRLLVDLAAGRFSVILATEEARLARNETEKFALMFACSQMGTTWETVRDGAVDPSTAAGALMAGIRGSIDAFESRRKAERQRQANQHKREKGLPGAGQRPFGFKADRITPEPVEADLIKRATVMALAGAKKWQLLQLFRESGLKSARGKEWHIANVIALLKRWRNAGYVEHDDEPFGPAVWPPIISNDRESALQMVRDIRSIYAGAAVPGIWKTPQHLATGIAKCECGKNLVASGNDNARIYRCAAQKTAGKGNGAGHVAIRAHIVDPLIVKEIVRVYFDEPELQANDSDDELGQLYASLSAVREKIARLLDIYTDGIIEKADYNKRVVPLQVERDSIEKAIADLAKNNAHTAMLIQSRKALAERYETYDNKPAYPNVTRGAFRVEAELEEAFKALSLEDQRRLVASSLSIVVSVGGRGSKRVKITRKAAAPSDRTESAVAVYV